MRSYFRNMFSDLAALPGKTRVVGGYDINNDEYILSAYNQDLVDFTADVLPNQDIMELGALEGDGFVNLNEGGVGDINLQEAIDLFESIGATVIATGTINALQAQIDSQAAEIQALIAELNASGYCKSR